MIYYPLIDFQTYSSMKRYTLKFLPKPSGQALVELAVGMSVLLLVVPFLADFLVLIVAANINNNLVAKAARVCSNQAQSTNFATAVLDVQNTQFHPNAILKSALITPPTLSSTQMLTVTSKMTINLPFGVPGFGQNGIVLTASATDPWVGQAPP